MAGCTCGDPLQIMKTIHHARKVCEDNDMHNEKWKSAI